MHGTTVVTELAKRRVNGKRESSLQRNLSYKLTLLYVTFAVKGTLRICRLGRERRWLTLPGANLVQKRQES